MQILTSDCSITVDNSNRADLIVTRITDTLKCNPLSGAALQIGPVCVAPEYKPMVACKCAVS